MVAPDLADNWLTLATLVELTAPRCAVVFHSAKANHRVSRDAVRITGGTVAVRFRRRSPRPEHGPAPVAPPPHPDPRHASPADPRHERPRALVRHAVQPARAILDVRLRRERDAGRLVRNRRLLRRGA